MGMSAEIIAIGPFSKNIIDVLEYPKEYYANVTDGAIITEELFGICEGSSVSREFALLLGISDTWDFNQHKIDNEKINISGLKKIVKLYTSYGDDYNALLVLIENNFEFHFRPQG